MELDVQFNNADVIQVFKNVKILSLGPKCDILQMQKFM